MHEKLDEQVVAVARVYARSLLELAQKNGEEQLLRDEFDAMVEQFDRQPQFEALLADPGMDEAAIAGMLERVLRDRANDLIVNTLQVMNRKGRGGLFRALVHAYNEELESLEGVVRLEATTAVPLSDDLKQRLIGTIATGTGKRVVLEESVDETLIGGMVLRLGDVKFDSSVARELWRVGERLEDKGSEQLQQMPVMWTEG
jgi:F-type H+-transporting ATPase subunit delta